MKFYSVCPAFSVLLALTTGCASGLKSEQSSKKSTKTKNETPLTAVESSSESPFPVLKVSPKAQAAPKGNKKLVDKIETSRAKTKYGAARSQEWKTFPKQRWESVDIKLPPGVDPDGFDLKKGKIFAGKDKGLDLDRIVFSERVSNFGDIDRADSEGFFLKPGDTVFIEDAANDVAPGQILSVTQNPVAISGEVTGNIGYVYLLLGRVKIKSRDGDSVIGEIVSGSFPITRSNYLIGQVGKMAIPTPRAAPADIVGLEAGIHFDDHFSAFLTGQHKIVFLDRGTQDGVFPGMIFEIQQLKDRYNSKSISRTPDSVIGHTLVLHSSTDYSTAIVYDSKYAFDKGVIGVLTADLSFLKKRVGSAVQEVDFKAGGKKDELDQFDENDSLTDQEKRELRQLEKWQKNPSPETAPTTSPTDAAPNLDELLPPESGTPAPAPDPGLPPPPPEGSPAPPTGGAEAPPEDLLPPLD